MDDAPSIVADALGVFLLVTSIVLVVMGVAADGNLPVTSSGMIACQVGILCFYFRPYREARKIALPFYMAALSAVAFVVSFGVIGYAMCFVILDLETFLSCGVFLTVHLVANFLLMLRPRVYLAWVTGVWSVGLIAGAILWVSPEMRLPVIRKLLATLTGGDARDVVTLLIRKTIWAWSLASMIGTAAGACMARVWIRRLQTGDPNQGE